MKTLPADLEALMPEPDGYLTDWPAIGGGMRKLYGPTRTAGDSLAFKVTPVYSEAKLHAAMQAATERAAKLDGAEIAAYALPAPGAGPIDQIRIERVRQMNGAALWAVRFRGDVLNKSGEWEWEPMPSGRDDDFLARARFDTAEEAIAAIRSGGEAGS